MNNETGQPPLDFSLDGDETPAFPTPDAGVGYTSGSSMPHSRDAYIVPSQTWNPHHVIPMSDQDPGNVTLALAAAIEIHNRFQSPLFGQDFLQVPGNDVSL